MNLIRMTFPFQDESDEDDISFCGNYTVEGDEECDCGLSYLHCNDPCCYAGNYNCKTLISANYICKTSISGNYICKTSISGNYICKTLISGNYNCKTLISANYICKLS
jgi:hypothetical protein